MLEQYFKLKWIEKKEHSFFLGFFYAAISIFAAMFFTSFVGLASIGLTACLLIPTLNALLQEEENIEIREKKFHIIQLFKDHYDIVKVYFFLFFGVFTAYLIVPLVFGSHFTINAFNDLLTIGGFLGAATAEATVTNTLLDNLIKIMLNNLLVIIIIMALSLIYGAGSIFYLTLNASVWGIVFGMRVISHNHFDGFVGLMYILPHTLLEGFGYILVAIAGGVLSKAIIRETIGSKQFNHVFTDALFIFGLAVVFIIIGSAVEVYFLDLLSQASVNQITQNIPVEIPTNPPPFTPP